MDIILFFIHNRGDSLTVQQESVTASAWKDRKVVTVLSTNTQPTATGTVLRRQKDGSRVPVPCPEAIISYNEFMGGVDRGDQLRGYYSCRTKSRKFYKYIFYFLLDVAITNAFVLYKHYAACSKYKTIRDFRVQLAKDLIGDYCSRRRAGRQGSFLKTLPLRHFPVKLESSDATRRNRHRCTRCQDKYGKRSDTQWFCQECAVPLCHTGKPSTDCFLLWHKNMDLQQ